MTDGPDRSPLRPMTHDDLAAVVAGQGPAATAALSAIFPQDTHPFPYEQISARWHEEIDDPRVDCFVITADTVVGGFAASREDELLHFGVDRSHQGTGLADRALVALMASMAHRGVRAAWLRVFTANHRARRFYDRHGWLETNRRSQSTFPPYPELLQYERHLDPPH